MTNGVIKESVSKVTGNPAKALAGNVEKKAGKANLYLGVSGRSAFHLALLSHGTRMP